jgi:predicted oxidoreductase (fatty acid repression mutant protein)
MSLNAKTTAFFEVAETRRSVYGLTDKIPIADETVVKIVETASMCLYRTVYSLNFLLI